MQEKTEKPTPKKLRDARQKGQVAQSKEVVSCALMVAVFSYFFALGPYWLRELEDILTLPTLFYQMPFAEALRLTFEGVWNKGSVLLGSLMVPVFLVGIASSLLQTGPLLSFHPIKPELKKIDPLQGAKKIFSLKNLVEFIKSVFKILFLSLLICWVIIGNFEDLLQLQRCDIGCVMPFLGHLMFQLAVVTAIAFTVVAVADFYFQRFNHTKELKMTKDEVKREYKDSEGNPEIKGHRRQLHRELLQSGMLDDVKRSSVLVCNPTHITVGIFFDFDAAGSGQNTRLPVVTLKGAGIHARRFKELAAEHGIPMLENVTLARALYAEAEVDDYIPSALIEPVAEVLKWVKQISGAG